MAGINSHAVRRIARECAALEPDAFVIYLGNNEVVGPFGPGTVFGGTTTSLAQPRASMALRTTKTGQLLDGLLDKLAGRDETRSGGMAMFAEQRVPQDHPAMPSVYDNFRANLRDILDVTTEKPTILCTVAVDLEDFPRWLATKRAAFTRRRKPPRAAGMTSKPVRFFPGHAISTNCASGPIATQPHRARGKREAECHADRCGGNLRCQKSRPP